MELLQLTKKIKTINQPEINSFLILGKSSRSNIQENAKMHNSAKTSSISPKQGSLSTIIRSYKSIVTKNVRKLNPNFSWQSRFYDNIIRNEQAYHKIEDYIINNPKK